jgi:hypothetical protein
MGFRNYAPGLNQFLSRDMYNGALADMQLATDPFTGNRYTFAAGNPITNIELDGHSFPGGAQCGTPGGTPCNPSPSAATSGGSSLQQIIPTCPIGMLVCFGAGFTEAPPRPQAPPTGGQNPPGSGDMGWLRWLPALAAAIAASGDLPSGVNTQDRSRGCFTSGEPQKPRYGELDFSDGATLGRATWAEACLTPPVQPNRGSARPAFPGWDSKTMVRAHLLAAWFGGTSTRINRVLFWRLPNLEMEQQIESKIYADLQAGKRVYYFAQPEYPLGPTGPGEYQPYMPTAIDITWGTAGNVRTDTVYNNP